MLTVAWAAATFAAGGGESDYEKGFRRRADFIIRQTALRDTDAMIQGFEASGYFRNAGGDAHKYAMPPVICKLYLDPKDEAALRMYRYLQDVAEKKPDRALYHFATFQRTRLYFQLHDTLPDWILRTNENDARDYMKVMLGDPRSETHGTDNHAFMHRCNGYLWAEYLGGAKPDSPLHAAYAFQKGWLERQVRKFYTAGQGEYDSSTYIGYTASSWANIYDFTKDPRVKELARSALDWLAASVAQKYFHGCLLGPESRGFADEAVGNRGEPTRRPGAEKFKVAATGSSTDWCAWLWWVDSHPGPSIDRADAEAERFPVHVLALSGYRPPEIIRHIATKNIHLPLEARGSKPTYYGTGDNKDQESLYFAQSFAMGTLYSGDDGIATTGTILPQTTMFKLLVRDGKGVHAFGMNQGYHKHYPLEGRSPFDQYHQKGAAAILVSYVPEDQVATIKAHIAEKNWPAANLDARSILGVPNEAGEAVVEGGWWFWQISNGTFVAARPLNGKAEFVELPGRQNEKDNHRWLVSPGKLTGWVVQAGEASAAVGAGPASATGGTLPDEFKAFRQRVASACKLDLSKFDSDREVTFTSLAGDRLKVRHTGKAGDKPDAWNNGQKLNFRGWPVFDSPYLREEVKSGVLHLTDGNKKLTIDCSGAGPRYMDK